MILAGDIGGTKTYLGLFSVEGARVRTVEIVSFKTLDFDSLESLVLYFLKGRDPIRSACFGIPGPVVDNCVEATNIPWKLNGYDLGRVAGIRHVYLVNDLVATGFGLGVLSPEETLVLNEGHQNGPATSALIAAGTGLGECILYWDGFEHVVLPCEAGHSDFAPHDDIQLELLQWLHKTHRYVCVERVLSGPGLVTIYDFLRETARGKENPDIAAEMRNGRFREDFFYRLCGDVITTPPLRSQLADSPGELRNLILFIAQRLVGEEEAERLASEVERWVEHRLGPGYPWAGNVRELEQCVRSVLVHREYHPAHEPRGDTRTAFADSVVRGAFGADELIARYCTLVYAQTGSYVETARRLGLDRRTVKDRIDAPFLEALRKES